MPTSSVATVYARGFRRQFDRDTTMLLEPGNTPLPSGLVIIPTVVSANSPVFPVQVINFSAEGVWLPRKARLGSLSQCECLEEDPYEVKFRWISENHEEVTISRREGQASDLNQRKLMDRLDIGEPQSSEQNSEHFC